MIAATIVDGLVMYAVLVAVFYPVLWVIDAAKAMTRTISCDCGKQTSHDVICQDANVNELRDAMTKNCPWCQHATAPEDD